MQTTGVTPTRCSHSSSTTEASAVPASSSLSLRTGWPLMTVALAQSLAVTTGFAADDAAVDPKDPVLELPKLSVEEQRRAVSSPKFTAPLVDTPQTVSVIPKEIFGQQGAASLADVLGNTPGITFLAGEGGHVAGSNSIVMRGFDAQGSIFIDGVRDSGNYGRDVYNLEQVEVVKGPAGDNGRGTAAGYINLSTKAPVSQDMASAVVSYGFDEYASIDRQRATLDVNRSTDSLLKGSAFRINVLGQDSGVAGRDYAEKKTLGIATSAIAGLGTPTRVTLSYQHDQQNDRPEFGALGGIVPDTSASTRPLQTVDRSRFYGLLSDYDDVTLDVASVRVEHDFTPTIRATNVTRYSNNDRKAIYTVPGGLDQRPDMTSGQIVEIVTTSRQAFAREVESIVNQTNVASQFTTGKFDHSFAGGLELIRENGHTLRDWTGLGTTGDITKTVNVTTAGVPTTPTVVTGTSPYNPNPARAITGFAPVYAFVDDIRIDTAAIYAFDTIKLTEKWQATGGARLERYKATYDVRAVATGVVSPFEASDTLLTGKVGLVFKPAPTGSVYASFGVAAQPPGTNNLSNDNGSRNNGTPGTTGQNSPNADPQESYNYEIGTKWDLFQRKLTTGLAFFRSERTNIAVATDAGTGVPTIYGDQIVQGVEISASGRITANWVLFGGWSYLDSENRNSTSTTQDGSNLTFTPEFSGNLWTTYRLPFGLTIGGGTQFTGSSRVSLTNTSLAELPEHWVFNAMAAYEVTKNLSVRLNVSNISDELYARAINNNSNRTYLGEPRSFLLTAEYKF
ncbi:TonB-dependent receptor [Oleiharenicola lentus]|uniref:TonB-dependent receptor n=1 Tax=Oleiharenicola lentus TaxID=2508720 RepID=UPI003F661001